jgi:CDP-diglyceride synthetase
MYMEEEQTTQWSKDTNLSFDHCVVCSSIYGFWLPLWYRLTIVLSVLHRYADFDYLFGIVWPLCCLFFFDILILITSLVFFGRCVVCSSSIYWFWLPLWYLLTIVLSVLLCYTDFDYLFGIFWPLCCLFVFDFLEYVYGRRTDNTMVKR